MLQHTELQQRGKEMVNPSRSRAPRPGIRTRTQIEVLLVDGHTLFRRGVRATLEATGDFRVVGEAADAQTALRMAEELLPRIVVVEWRLSDQGGLELCRTLKRRLPEIACIVLSPHYEDDQLFGALRAGASAYSSKDVNPQELLELTRKVAKDHYFINDSVIAHPGVARQVLNQFQALEKLELEEQDAFEKAASTSGLFLSLSSREMEVLDCIARGNSNKEIARQLSISDQTVKNHMSSILKKLNANDRTQAVMIGLRQGWIKL